MLLFFYKVAMSFSIYRKNKIAIIVHIFKHNERKGNFKIYEKD